MFQFFQDEDAGAFADDEAIAIFVEGTAGVRGIVIARGKRAHGGETADAHGGDGGFCSAGNHHIGIVAFDHAIRIADGMRAGGAGGSGSFIGTFSAPANADLSGSKVDDGGGNKKRRDLARATGQHGAVFALNNVETADAGANMDADPLGVFRRNLQSGRFECFLSRGQAKWMKRPILRASFFSMKRWGSKSLTSAAKVTEKPCRVKRSDGRHAALARQQIVPHLIGGFSHTANKTNARDNDTPLQGKPLFLLPFTCKQPSRASVLWGTDA